MTGLAVPVEWIVPAWPAPSNVRALVTTRAGGVSQGPYGAGTAGGMNIGLASGDEAQAVRANRQQLTALLPGEPRWLRQVHGAVVVSADEDGGPGQADAAVAATARRVCVVSIADCLPVLFVDTGGRAVAAAHAGWRGLAGGVLQNTATALRRHLDDPRAELLAWLGPAIGPQHFEVGDDVFEAMTARLPQAHRAFVAAPGGKRLCDLFALARQALSQVGVERIHGGGLCTYSDASRFYSYRRDRVTGRHAALIWRES